jgi:predicted DNA-binding ribbon-helix-helix protein
MMPHNAKSAVTTRSIVVDGMMTTISLEDPFWRELEMAAKENDLTVAEVVSTVESDLGGDSDLPSALREYVTRVRN